MFKFRSAKQAYITVSLMMVIGLFIAPLLWFTGTMSFKQVVLTELLVNLVAAHARSGLLGHTYITATEMLKEHIVRKGGNDILSSFKKSEKLSESLLDELIEEDSLENMPTKVVRIDAEDAEEAMAQIKSHLDKLMKKDSGK